MLEFWPDHISSIFHGTALDTSLLIDHRKNLPLWDEVCRHIRIRNADCLNHPVESYIFQGPDEPSIDQHLVLGISLGGHSAWQVLFNEPRVTAAVIIIGCPDYMRKCCLSPLHSITQNISIIPMKHEVSRRLWIFEGKNISNICQNTKILSLQFLSHKKLASLSGKKLLSDQHLNDFWIRFRSLPYTKPPHLRTSPANIPKA